MQPAVIADKPLDGRLESVHAHVALGPLPRGIFHQTKERLAGNIRIGERIFIFVRGKVFVFAHEITVHVALDQGVAVALPVARILEFQSVQ